MGKHKNKKNKQLQSEESSPSSAPISPVTSQMTPLSSPAIVPDSPLQVPSVINEENSIIESVVVQVQQEATNSETIKEMIEQAQKDKEQKFLRLLEEQKAKIREAQQDLENLIDQKEQALADLTKEQEIHDQLKEKEEQAEAEKEEEIEGTEEEQEEEEEKPAISWYKRLLRFFISK